MHNILHRNAQGLLPRLEPLRKTERAGSVSDGASVAYASGSLLIGATGGIRRLRFRLVLGHCTKTNSLVFTSAHRMFSYACRLFAAWRAMPVPTGIGPGGRAAVLLRLMREHRTGAHLLAIRAGGLTPLEALIAGPEGEAGAIAYGWQPPFPPFGPLIRRRIWVDAITDRIVGEAFRVLSVPERNELVKLLGQLLGAGRASGPRT